MKIFCRVEVLWALKHKVGDCGLCLKAKQRVRNEMLIKVRPLEDIETMFLRKPRKSSIERER
jgi:hypothetical protein